VKKPKKKKNTKNYDIIPTDCSSDDYMVYVW